jgi:cytoskeletal protein CcmA (bactofilin family)
MFNAKKPESGLSLSSNPSVETEKPAGSRNFTTYASAAEANYSIINERLTMRGDLESEADILVKGNVHGNIKCKMLIIDTDALVEGGIVADEVVIRGRAKGIIKAKRVRFEKTAQVDSEIFQDSFSAEEGARIRGALRFTEDLAGAEIAAEQKQVQAADKTADKAAGSQLYQMLDAARTSTPAARPVQAV